MSTPCAVAQRHVEHCMGTVFSIDVRSPGVEHRAIEDVVHWLHRVDATFSPYRSDSDISRLGRGELSIDDCTPDVRAVLARCAELTAQTDGYFDHRAGGVLDPSGYVKGWAVERAGDLLAAAGSVNHCVNGGGDVQCVGGPEPGRDWCVGIADPARPGRTLATASGRRIAVATSGSAERGGHIVDPHTGGHPGSYASITVVGTSLAEVDAYATAAFAMGAAAPDWLESRGLRSLLVRPDGRTTITY